MSREAQVRNEAVRKWLWAFENDAVDVRFYAQFRVGDALKAVGLES